ncbi:hypothetical protein HYT51_00280 [Candidatus Woesearchaeota archaeon]|nr:hypothetical protein [Candidatus Woesearchaeota archaeon]
MIITEKSLRELNESGINYTYARSPNGRDFHLYSTGKTYGEAFDNFASLLEEECRDYDGVCEVRKSDEHQDKGLITLVGRIISVNKN